MGSYHISNSCLRKIDKIGIAGFWVHTQGAGGSITRAEDICTYNKIIVWIEKSTFPNQPLPPVGRIRVSGKCMANPYHFSPRLISAPGMIPYLKFRQNLTVLQCKGLGVMEYLHHIWLIIMQNKHMVRYLC